MKTEAPSPFCPDFCSFVKARDFCCKELTVCWHLKDREVPPKAVELNIGGVSRRVTIVGENEVFAHLWYLGERDGLPSMLPKNYEIFSTPRQRQEPSKKEQYDTQKKKERENRNQAHK